MIRRLRSRLVVACKRRVGFVLFGFVMCLKAAGLWGGSAAASEGPARPAAERPNVILLMTDDQGWADAGYQGHPTLQTPHLDQMAREGIVFERFYACSPVCSPTRAGVLTGRHPQRLGILHANAGGPNAPSRYVLPEEETTIAEVLRDAGYATGLFGKWHLGDLTGPNVSTPSDHGFETWFATVRKVRTFDPEAYVENGRPIDGPLEGDDSTILMDRTLAFIDAAAERDRPFLAVVWFHTPHLPVVASEEDRRPYAEHGAQAAHYWGALTAMDRQVGRLRERLERLGLSDSTMLWFCSDNGPEGRAGRAPGSAGPLRGRKRDLFEGGIRVPGLLVWPGRFDAPRTIATPASVVDYWPTILDLLGLERPEADQRPLDGVSLRPILEGETRRRGKPLGFWFQDALTWIDGRSKLVVDHPGAAPLLLFDLEADPEEQRDLSAAQPDRLRLMKAALEAWKTDCQADLDRLNLPARRR